MSSRFKLVLLNFWKNEDYAEVYLNGEKRVLVYDEKKKAYFWCTKQQLIELVKEERCA